MLGDKDRPTKSHVHTVRMSRVNSVETFMALDAIFTSAPTSVNKLTFAFHRSCIINYFGVIILIK